MSWGGSHGKFAKQIGREKDKYIEEQRKRLDERYKGRKVEESADVWLTPHCEDDHGNHRNSQ